MKCHTTSLKILEADAQEYIQENCESHTLISFASHVLMQCLKAIPSEGCMTETY